MGLQARPTPPRPPAEQHYRPGSTSTITTEPTPPWPATHPPAASPTSMGRTARGRSRQPLHHGRPAAAPRAAGRPRRTTDAALEAAAGSPSTTDARQPHPGGRPTTANDRRGARGRSRQPLHHEARRPSTAATSAHPTSFTGNLRGLRGGCSGPGPDPCTGPSGRVAADIGERWSAPGRANQGSSRPSWSMSRPGSTSCRTLTAGLHRRKKPPWSVRATAADVNHLNLGEAGQVSRKRSIARERGGSARGLVRNSRRDKRSAQPGACLFERFLDLRIVGRSGLTGVRPPCHCSPPCGRCRRR
ncbi:hypothetical protein SAMN05421812_1266 [Asanoa hainanensis]|uniref:Uncharacterized protein n=1 Tax=Asanoa hainanensis TaxID=560556 RepID=A0A239PF69_9ACTN|nr:hypothetical protein SAMN05421812_1266 [Asanoa hainanensis]